MNKKVENTPIGERPLIDFNGIVQPMDDSQYEEYLREQGNTPPISPPTPEDRLAALERTSLEQDAALMELADMLGMLMGGV